MKIRMRLLCVVLAVYLSGCTAVPQETLQPTAPPVCVTEPDLPTAQPTEPEPPATQSALTEQVEPADEDFVRIRDYIPTVAVELAYATQNNFTGQRIYDFTEPWLRYGTVKKLMQVQAELEPMGLYLKIWDGFRPVAAQFALWEVCPISTYVANPVTGYSSHSRGNTVDITLVDSSGNELAMPTAFDEFSDKADRNYNDCDMESAENALLLENTMKKYGFVPYSGEWWHFADETRYPPEEQFQPVEEAGYCACGNHELSLRAAPELDADSLAQIPAGGEVRLLALYGEFAYVSYCGQRGYVPAREIEPVVQPRTAY